MNGRMHWPALWVTGAALACCLVVSSPSWAGDLLEVYDLAKSNDPTFQSAQYAFEAAKEKRPEAFSVLLPSLGANGAIGYTDGTTKYTGTPRVGRGFEDYNWTLQLTQPVFNADKLLAYGQAKWTVAQALAQFEAAAQDLIVRVAQAYFDVVVAERTVAAADVQVTALREQLNTAQHSFAAGVASITDVDDAQSRSASAEAQRVAAVDDLDAKQAALEAIIGVMPQKLAVLGENVVLPRPDPEDVAPWKERATSDNPSVRATKAALESASYDLRRSRVQRLPTLNLVGSYGGNYSSGNIINPINYSTNSLDSQVSLQLSMPLLDGGGLHAQVVEARAKQQKAQADYDAARRAAALQAHQAYSAVLSSLSQVQALRIAATAGQNAVKGNRAGYRLGIRINSDVLNSEQQLFSTQRDLIKARYDALFQGIKLKAAAGNLTEGDLQSINALLTERIENVELDFNKN